MVVGGISTQMHQSRSPDEITEEGVWREKRIKSCGSWDISKSTGRDELVELARGPGHGGRWQVRQTPGLSAWAGTPLWWLAAAHPLAGPGREALPVGRDSPHQG